MAKCSTDEANFEQKRAKLGYHAIHSQWQESQTQCIFLK